MTNPLNHLSSFQIYLGSASPRRQTLFSTLGIDFKTITSDVPEIIPENTPPEQGPVYLSNLKSNDLISKVSGNFLLITADTIVLLDQDILGKPTDLHDATQMLTRLQGRNHQVITGVTIKSQNSVISFSDKTDVCIEPMTDEEIRWSIHRSEVVDKAGAYGIQDWLGMTKVSRIEGSYYNVMGLPIDKLYRQLLHWGTE